MTRHTMAVLFCLIAAIAPTEGRAESTWIWGTEVRWSTIRNNGSTRDEFAHRALQLPYLPPEVGYKERPGVEVALTAERRAPTMFGESASVPVLSISFLRHRSDFGLTGEGDAQLGLATFNAVRIGAGEATTFGRWRGGRWRVGLVMGIAWPGATSPAASAATETLGVVRIARRAQALLGFDSSIEARIPATPLWLALRVETSKGFGPPPIEMVTDASSRYASGYAGFAPTSVGVSLAWR